jgi:hypothetical protein
MSEEKESSRIIRKLCVIIPILMLAVLITGCSKGFTPQDKPDIAASLLPVPSTNGPINGLVQSNTGGAVTIDVEWLGLDDGFLAFAVALNTHSVDLDQYDLGKLVVLRDDEGKEYHPTTWDSAPGGHHRRGTLAFSPLDSLNQGTEYLELIIRDVAGIDERSFRWEMN